MYEPSINYAKLDFKPFDCQEKVNEFLALLKYPEVQAVLELFIDNALAKSELMVLKRISTLEGKLGVSDMGLKDDELTIPEQLNLLASRIDNTVENYKPNLEPLQSAATKTENRAHLLVGKLKSLRGKKHLDSKEIVQFLKYGIEERFRAKDGQNIRQIKKEVLKKAESLFKGEVELNKRNKGRREVRLILS